LEGLIAFSHTARSGVNASSKLGDEVPKGWGVGRGCSPPTG